MKNSWMVGFSKEQYKIRMCRKVGWGSKEQEYEYTKDSWGVEFSRWWQWWAKMHKGGLGFVKWKHKYTNGP